MKFVIPFAYCVSKRDKKKIWKHGGRRTPALSDRWRDGLTAINLLATSQKISKSAIYTEPVYVEFQFWFPDRRRTDPQNYTELIFDALEGVAYTNDKQCSRHCVELMGYDKENPRVEITVQLRTQDS